MKCPNCGEELKEGYLYCEKCGEEIMIVPDFEPENPEVSEKESGRYFNRAFYGEYPVSDATELFKEAATVFRDGIPTPFGEYVFTDGTVLTPCGAAIFAGACSAGGIYRTPHAAVKLTDASGKLIYRIETEEHRLMEADTAKHYLACFSERIAENGIRYRYAQTEVFSGTTGMKHCLAMVLVPAENPTKAISVVLELRRGVEDGALLRVVEEIICAMENNE